MSGFERSAVILLLAVLLDLLLGDPPNRFHPVVWMGSFIRGGAAKAPPTNPRRQFLFGAGVVLLGAALFSLFPLVVGWLLRPLVWLDVALSAALLKSTFSLRRLLQAGRGVEDALRTGDLEQARRLTAWHLVSRDTASLDEGHTASAAVESLAENLTDSFLAPLLAFALGGLPLAWAYRFVNTTDAMIGYHDQRHEYLGKFAARLDDILNYLPARLAGALLCLAALPARLDFRRAWQVMAHQHAVTASPNAGWTMSAAAGALGVRLEKIAHYTLEGGAQLPAAGHIRAARRLLAWAAGLGVCVCLILMRLLAL